ncbi:hypothetical protein PGT21_012702 [Puccinia graminis f. sp. tritici]|uniref:Uncharacterized protein n=1 Tax=Puccinia graminis f. sp. tritici TaxID=56615 RepID=A0A5B0P4E2_PUCGR|nr:hypothetical protein PGT21_012702 [Puccinia graminis f. sp. tritici]
MARPKLPAEDISSESRQPSSRLFTIGILVPNIGMSFRVPRLLRSTILRRMRSGIIYAYRSQERLSIVSIATVFDRFYEDLIDIAISQRYLGLW